ncbi:S8 family peptidase [Edaphocola aurantiacus]|uniref:S8 family peptidase n=1 Tax=Edaphocola aurantiacus TaxID=2601682 RepID=UPI001C97E90A|nr:S8 family peptidase [Edaphocola aurantiacus]
MKHALHTLLLGAAVAGSVLQASGQQLFTDKGTLPLQSRSATQFLTMRTVDFGTKEKHYVLLSFNHILSAEERSRIEATGVQLKDWYPGNSYIAQISNLSQNLDQLQSLAGKRLIPLTGVNDLPTAVKISTTLQELQDASTAQLMVSVYDKADISSLQQYLETTGLKYTREDYCGDNALVLSGLSQEQIQSIARLSFVASVEIYAGEPQNTLAGGMFANQVFAANYQYNLGAAGNGVYFGNYETFGEDTLYDLNMRGRQHPQYFGTGVGAHGTTIAAIVGAANNYNEFDDRGTAPGVTSLYVGWYNTAENYYLNNNVKPMLSNHSVGWGDGQVTYNNDARELDRIARTLGGYLHSYSAGNSGGSGPFLGYPAGWANLTGDIKVSKNNFTVHSSAKPGEHCDWTSKGPTRDGRLKPDICAEGINGSSYAAPAISGFAALLFEVYNTTYGTTVPRSDVVKAVMLNTAYDIDKKGIDFKTGFGTMNPLRAKRAIEQQHLMTGSMPQGSGGAAQYTIAVPAGTSEAKFMLYWHDYQGAVGAVKALVNNLDVFVISPVGDTLRPWVLNPTGATVYDLPLRKTDTLNNVEQVTIDNPLAGNYTVYVKGIAVPQGPQPYALTYDMVPYQIEITSPVAAYRMPKGNGLMMTWNISNQQAGTADSLEVYLQRSSAESFTQLATLDYNKRYYEYTVPTSFPNSATARIVVKQRNTGLVDTSDYFHVMVTPTNLSLTRMCTDTIGLRWDTVAANAGGKYIIYRLGNKYMEPVDSVLHPANKALLSAATVLGAGQQWNGTQYFAVAARHSSGALSVRTLPISTILTDPINSGSTPALSTLCYEDTVKWGIGNLQYDSVRWYNAANNAQVSTAVQLSRTFADTGNFYFRTFLNGCIYTSPTYTIKRGEANIADMALWGNFKWLVSAYSVGNTSSNPFYGANPKYYGQFSTDSLGFNSNDYYTWYGTGPHNAPGYHGCAFSTASAVTTVYKRKGFTRGIYQINLLRAAGKLKMTINNGTTTQYISPNNAFTINNIWTGILDTNSTIRVEAYAEHNNIQIVLLPIPLPASLNHFEAKAIANNRVQLDFIMNATSPDITLYASQGTDARHFDRTVASVKLSEGTNTYQIIDDYPSKGMNYYRLYWKNNDGYIKYSPVLNVKIKEGAEGISVFPTITKDGQVTIQLHEGWEEAECKVLNILGQQVAAVITGAKEHKEISLKSLPPGTYLLTFKDHERQLVYKVVYQP